MGTERLETVLVYGDHLLACSISVNLALAGHEVVLTTRNKKFVENKIESHRKKLADHGVELDMGKIRVYEKLTKQWPVNLAILITEEKYEHKSEIIKRMEKVIPANALLAINTESVPLKDLQENMESPERLIGLNWSESAYNTQFLEIIANEITSEKSFNHIKYIAQHHWNKNPYLIKGDLGIRAKIFASMVREAFYLIENDYASAEDIDRAFRNDPGFYLPFCGNIRYMDLMGTYAYGMVMKDLNPELSRDESLPSFYQEKIAAGAKGMSNQQGIYNYGPGEADEWINVFEEFSFKIKDIMSKYPFDYRENADNIKKY